MKQRGAIKKMTSISKMIKESGFFDGIWFIISAVFGSISRENHNNQYSSDEKISRGKSFLIGILVASISTILPALIVEMRSVTWARILLLVITIISLLVYLLAIQ